MGTTIHLDNLIAYGEIEQHRRNSVLAQLWIRGEEEIVVALELAGNLEGIATGRTFRFRANELSWDGEPDLDDCRLQLFQQGVVGRCTIDPTPPVPHDPDSSSEVTLPSSSQSKNLFFEWWSQDGHIVLKLDAACVEFEGEYHELEDLIEYDEEVPELECEDSDEGEPDWLTDPPDSELAERIKSADGIEPIDLLGQLPIEAAKSMEAEMTWEEIVESESEETKTLYQEWDEILHGKNHEPVDWLIDDSVRLPPPDQIRDDAEAVEVLRKLLSRLAPLGIVLDMCEHISDLDAYRMLVEDFLPGTEVHPRMGASGFVHHFCTWEYCDQCDEENDEFDEESDEAMDGDSELF